MKQLIGAVVVVCAVLFLLSKPANAEPEREMKSDVACSNDKKSGEGGCPRKDVRVIPIVDGFGRPTCPEGTYFSSAGWWHAMKSGYIFPDFKICFKPITAEK